MDYQLFRHNFKCLHEISWGEDRQGNEIMFELMDTAAVIATENVRLPEMKRGIRVRHLKLKDLPDTWKTDLTHPCWSHFTEVIDAATLRGRFVLIVDNWGKAIWSSYGY